MSIDHGIVHVNQAALKLFARSKQLDKCRKLCIFEGHLDKHWTAGEETETEKGETVKRETYDGVTSEEQQEQWC